MHSKVAMTSTSQHVVVGGSPLPHDDLEHTNMPVLRAQQVDTIMALRERVQNPPPGESSLEDLVWTDHVTNGKGSRLVVILWDRLDNFISREQLALSTHADSK